MMNSFPFAELILILYTISLSVLLLYSSHGFIMLYYQHKFRNKSSRLLQKIDTSKVVTIQLPLFNEMYVAERLINAVCKLDYPKESLEIQVLDDSSDETVNIVANIVKQKREQGFLISHVQRKNRVGFKAGALKEGLAKAKGEFIAIFDADFIPPSNFLINTLSHFYSNNIGMVQTRWEHLNEKHSFLTRIQAFALNGHFGVEQKIRNDAGFFINFNGTAGVWRKECIVESGNWGSDTLTEDLDLSYRAQLKGWEFVFLKDITTPSELPTEISSLKTQQFRWTKGAIETAIKLLPSVWKSNLSLKVKLQSTFHLTNNLVYPFVLVVAVLNLPILFIKQSGYYDTYFYYSSLFIFAFISTLLFYIIAQKSIYTNWRRKIIIFPFFLSTTMGLALNNTKAVYEGITNKKSEFIRTPKFVQAQSFLQKNRYASKSNITLLHIAELIFTIYSLIAVAFSLFYFQLAALSFNFMFFFGFFLVTVLSLKDVLTKN
ncbi:MAG: glycosyltransferase [Melioribacteraceae bacterium]|jgi:cellulose synthase/poly-beta-1,6-N-acetylglucosamine synthase-like glycosyltransferase|nr:glycosyltransferase [Melioribacteraceae bacterium]